jgi:hypothetical protein
VDQTPRKGLLNTSYYALAIAAWIVLVVLAVTHHELWRDEFQAILLGFESGSIRELIFNTRYEGHGAAWYLAVFGIGKLGGSVIAVQLFHFCISLSAVVLIIFRSPFSITEKLLIIFGYYFLYEYTVITRNYSLAVLALMLVAHSLSSVARWRHYLFSVALILLANTSAYGCILSIVILCYYWVTEEGNKVILSLVVIAGIAVSVLKMIPPADSGFAKEWYLGFDFQKMVHSFEIIYEALLPIPKVGIHFWGSNILDGSPVLTGIKLLLSLALLIGAKKIIRDKKLYLLFLAGTLGIVMFTYVKYEGFLRHYGHIFLLLILCIWVARRKTETKEKQNVFKVVLVCQVLVSAFAFVIEYQKPFSGAKDAAKFISERYPDAKLYAYPDFIGTPVAGFLNKEVYFPQSDRTGKFILFDEKRKKVLSNDEVVEKIKVDSWSSTLLLLNIPLDSASNMVKLVYKSREDVIEEDERYYVYVHLR